MKSVKWSKEARRDIQRIPDFMPADILPDVAAEIVGAARFLASAPKAGAATRNHLDRKLPVKRFPYLLIYRVNSEAIYIARVVHAKSDWQNFV